MRIIAEHIEYTSRKSRVNPQDKTRIWKLELKPQPGLIEFENFLNLLMSREDMTLLVDAKCIRPEKI